MKIFGIKKAFVAVLIVLGMTGAAFSLAGCSTQPSYNAVCVDKSTNQRVSDQQCSNTSHAGSSAFLWYYLATSNRIAKVGDKVSGGSFSKPSKGTTVNKGVTTKGGYTNSSGKGSYNKAPKTGGGYRGTTGKSGGGFRGGSSYHGGFHGGFHH